MPATQSLAVKDRLIVALDVPTFDQARTLVEELDNKVNFFKIGYELMYQSGNSEFVDWLVQRKGKKLFADLKLNDIPRTVEKGVKALTERGASFITVHAIRQVMEAAASAKTNAKILAVTVVTSMEVDDLHDQGINCSNVNEIIERRTVQAQSLGCDGVICSPLEGPILRPLCPSPFLLVTPGIRPVDLGDDQKRIATVAQAFANGSDHIVVGRPITQADQPAAIAEQMQDEIAGIFDS